MSILVRKPRAGDAGLPTNVPASADGDCGGAFVGQIAHTLQAANGAARLRRAHIFERDAEGHYVEPLWCSARLFEAESFGAPGARVLDSACGWGRILRAAHNAGYAPVGSNVVDRHSNPQAFTGFPFKVCNFLTDSPIKSAWSVVCNPSDAAACSKKGSGRWCRPPGPKPMRQRGRSAMNPRRNPRRNPLPRSRLSHAELITIRVNAVVGAMHGGAVLHLHFENGEQRWHLSGGGDVGSEIALAVLDCPEVENLDDALPLAGGAFPQTTSSERRKLDDQRSH